MKFYEESNLDMKFCEASCQCDDYCNDSPSGPTGCDDDNEGWHSND